MTTILTKSNSRAYAIYVDGRKIVECNEPESSYNDLVKNIGINIDKVQVFEADSFPMQIDTTSGTLKEMPYVQGILHEVISEHDRNEDRQPGDLDSIIANVNASITAKNLGAYKAVTERNDIEDYKGEGTVHLEVSDAKSVKEPVGNVPVPKLGDLVYVEGLQGFLKTVTGGVGTVHMVYEGKNNVPVAEYNDFEDDDYTLTQNQSNLLIELEEVPGAYFNWNDLKNAQIELKAKYGYKPACLVK